MSTAELLLNLAVLTLVLHRNVGTHAVGPRRFVLPTVIIVVVAVVFLRNVPGTGNDPAFIVLGGLVGVVLGALAGSIPRIWRESDGVVSARAGVGFAALWIIVIGGRIAFAYGATYVFPGAVASWSRAHQISGSDAFTAMFVVMALAMVATMTVVISARVQQARASSPPVIGEPQTQGE